MALTDLQARRISPQKKRFEILDGNGLYLRVMPTGKKSWVFRYYFEGTPRRMTLGSYPALTLAEAREKHSQATQSVSKGIDPGEVAAQEKAKRKAAPTFSDLLDEFWDEELSKQSSGKERKRLITKDVLGRWKNRKVSVITRRDAVLLLDKVRERAPITANRVQGILVRMFNFASERGIIEHSPLTGMKRGKEKSRARVLTDAEIVSLWNALDIENKDIDIYIPTKLAIKMILLTGQRPGEVANMAWSDIVDDLWIIPEDKSKTEGNKVPLLSMAKEVLETAQSYTRGTPFVFESSYKEGMPLTVRALSNAIRRHRAEIGILDHFTPHDLRRTVRTRLAEIGVSDITAEKVLGHKLQGVLAIYNRHEYLAEKREAMRKWESKLKTILGMQNAESNGKVVSITEARKYANVNR